MNEMELPRVNHGVRLGLSQPNRDSMSNPSGETCVQEFEDCNLQNDRCSHQICYEKKNQMSFSLVIGVIGSLVNGCLHLVKMQSAMDIFNSDVAVMCPPEFRDFRHDVVRIHNIFLSFHDILLTSNDKK